MIEVTRKDSLLSNATAYILIYKIYKYINKQAKCTKTGPTKKKGR